MASSPSEVSNFDFGPDPIYSSAALADYVVWPLVDGLWHGNWQQDSEDGDRFRFPKKGTYNGRELSVELEAECEAWETGDTIHSATLYIEEAIPADSREFILSAAKLAWAEQSEDEDDDESPEWPDWPEDESEIVVKNSCFYSFDSDGDWTIQPYRVVISPLVRKNVPFCEAERDFEALERLRLHDVENIEAACFVLSAPRAIMKALRDIKANPILL